LSAVRMRASKGYHAGVVRSYWEQAEATHGDMSGESFEFYATQISEILGAPGTAGLVLDHGAGDGRIGSLLIAQGYSVEFSEFAPQFVERIAAAGQRCYPSDDVPEGRFDTVFVNNAIFYVHPSELLGEIGWLLRRLRAGGRLLLLDVPTIQRESRLRAGPALRLVHRLTLVHQPQAGGFFVDERRIRKAFRDVRIGPSWCDYRAHIEIRT